MISRSQNPSPAKWAHILIMRTTTDTPSGAAGS